MNPPEDDTRLDDDTNLRTDYSEARPADQNVGPDSGALPAGPTSSAAMRPDFVAIEDEWRTVPTDLGGWANRAAQMRELAKRLQMERDYFEQRLHAYKSGEIA